MDREQLERHLALAETIVALSHEVIAEQRLVVAGLMAWGLDASAALQCFRLSRSCMSGIWIVWRLHACSLLRTMSEIVAQRGKSPLLMRGGHAKGATAPDEGSIYLLESGCSLTLPCFTCLSN
jgi:hypothetical protein